MIAASVNFEEALRDIERIANRIEPAARGALIAATAKVYAASHGELAKLVYNTPETEVLRRNRKTRKVRSVRLWKRKSALLRGERASYPERGKLEGRIYNEAEYAEARHDLKYPARTPYHTLEEAGEKTVTRTSKRGKRQTKTVKAYRRVAKLRPDRTAHWRQKARDDSESAAQAVFDATFAAALDGEN